MRKQIVTHAKRSGERMIVDNFAGGGGASTGIELALGRSPDVAINHDPEALAMHQANHPHTRHYATDVFDVDPLVVCRNQPVGLAWFSPDCTHHSKARGGKPIREAGKKSRSLAWVVVRWAMKVRPEVIFLENVEEFQQWGPLVDGRPCPVRKGKTFRLWVRKLQRLGYVVEMKELRACDYGAPTIRKRLFIIARCDGKKIVWPEPTHGKPGSPEVVAGKRLPWRTAAEIIDWTLPCPSIFLTPTEAKQAGCKRPLKEATMRRISRGLQRFVINHPNPFIVYANHGGDWFRGRGIDDPMATVTASRDAVGLVTPYVQTYHGTGEDQRTADMQEPLRTQDTENRFGVVAPVMTYAQQGGGNRDAAEPMHTVTASRKDQNAVFAPYCVPRYTERDGQLPRCGSVDEPSATITPTANGASLVAPVLTRDFGNSVGGEIDGQVPTVMPGGGGKTGLVSAFLTKFRTGATGVEVTEPVPTVTANSFVKRPGGAPSMGVVSAFMAQHNTGVVGHHATEPVSTLSQKGAQQQVVAASFISNQYTSNSNGGQGDLGMPVKTITTGGHHAHVMAFLQKYYGTGGQDADCRDPMHTLTAKARMGLVTVQGVDFQIVDIGMRMLSPRELYRAQGFPEGYRIAVHHNGRPLPKSSQVRMCGNSVCPPIAAALVKANCGHLVAKKRQAVRQRELVGV